MNSYKTEQLRAIFDEAAERPESERTEFVRSACGDDAELEREVRSLLNALDTSVLDADAGTWLGSGTAQHAGERRQSHDDEPVADLRGEVVGDFRLLRAIGKGAMGSVYEAEQISIQRRVAVKLLQSWAASRDSRRRFVEESETLAKLTHQGIAHVIAAGTRKLDLSGPDQALAAGIFSDLHSVPWIAMELVEGARTIVDWSRGQRPLEVVGMFARVCDALHHGHQQGIIHRDLKPANILVNDRDEPKIIDFGIARAISVGPAAAPSNTRTGVLLGSPLYMSPEQCEGNGAAIDTRSDVYSLGVVLYQALTGAMPYDVEETAITACIRTICQTPAADPRSVAPGLSKDIAAMLLKALRKSTAERYQSASDFAADLRRVLNQEPVMARATPWTHRAALLVRRRPVMSILVFVALLGVITGVAGISIGLAKERVARRAADREAWLANLTAADSYLRDGNGGMAIQRLNAIPEARRGWEWHLLYAKSDTSADVWQLSSEDGRTQISPSGTLVASYTNSDRRVTVYEIATRKALCTFEDMAAGGRCSWSSDERRIAFTRVTEIVVADLPSGRILQRIPMPAEGFAIGPGWSPDGTQIVAGMTSPLGIRVFRIDTGECLFSRPSDTWIFDAKFSPDGRTIAWCGELGVEVVDTKTWTTIHDIPVPRPAQHEQGWLAFSPDGRTLALGFGRDGYLIDPVEGFVRVLLRGHSQRIHSVAFDDSGLRLLTTSIDRTVRLWNVADGSPGPVLLGHEAPTGNASFIRGAGSRERSVISVGADKRMRWWSLDSGRPVFEARINDFKSHIAHVEFSSDQSALWAIGGGGVAEITLDPWPGIAQARGTERVALGAIPSMRLLLHETNADSVVAEYAWSNDRLWSVPSEPIVRCIAASLNGEVIAVGQNSSVLLLDACNGRERCKCNVGLGTVHDFELSNDGTLLATNSYEGEVAIWNTRTGALLERLAPKGERGVGFAWNTDASWIAYCHADEGITILDLHTRKAVTRIDNVGGSVFSLALSPDGKRLAVGAKDRICHIYDIPSGDEVLQLRNHVGTVMCAAWSPDGRCLATGGYDKTVVVYRAFANPSGKSNGAPLAR